MKIYYSATSILQGKKTKNRIPKIGILRAFSEVMKKWDGSELMLKKLPYCDSFFLDSGAFTAWTQGIEIDIEAYIDFIKVHEHLLDVYAALDVIGDAKATLKNYKRMKKAGLDPLPTFHLNEENRYLEYYVETTDYIALGGIAKSQLHERVGWLDPIFRANHDKVEFHGFGLLKAKLIKRYPWKTLDGTFPFYLARTGGITTPLGTFIIGERNTHPDRFQNWELLKPTVAAKVKDWVHDVAHADFDLARRADNEGSLERLFINIHAVEMFVEKTSKTMTPPYAFQKNSPGFNL